MSPALCQWSEVMNHPGLVCCVQQTTGIPLVIMVKPDTFLIQEIKTLPAKAKVGHTTHPDTWDEPWGQTRRLVDLCRLHTASRTVLSSSPPPQIQDMEIGRAHV